MLKNKYLILVIFIIVIFTAFSPVQAKQLSKEEAKNILTSSDKFKAYIESKNTWWKNKTGNELDYSLNFRNVSEIGEDKYFINVSNINGDPKVRTSVNLINFVIDANTEELFFYSNLEGLIPIKNLHIQNYNIDELYNESIVFINKWINSIPKDQYQKASEDQVFMWKVELEELDNNYDRYIYYNELKKEIENKEFKYEHEIYNKKSLKYRSIYPYTKYFSKSYNENLEIKISPSEFLRDNYNYYKSNINSKKEQFTWLEKFMSFLSSDPYNGDKEFYNSIVQNDYEIIQEILRNYITLGKYFLENEPDFITNATVYYSDSTLFSSQSDAENILHHLEDFSDALKPYLKQEEKEIILNYALPKYQNNDYAVKIYSILSE